MTILRFLGSIYFAIIIFAILVLFGIAGTVIESVYDSHAYASQFTYGHPFFILILAMAFVNILVSALLRWPFRWRHLPFLITHLGLLMVIGGALLKVHYGLQGNMVIAEGREEGAFFLTGTEALWIDKRPGDGSGAVESIQLDLGHSRSYNLDGTEYVLSDQYENVKEQWEHWVKDGFLDVRGIGRMPLSPWPMGGRTLPAAKRIKDRQVVDLYAVNTSYVDECVRELYIDRNQLSILCKFTGECLQKVPLKDVLQGERECEGWAVKGELTLREPPILTLTVHRGLVSHETLIPLSGAALLHNHASHDAPFYFVLRKSPMIAFIMDAEGEIHLLTAANRGAIGREKFSPENLNRFYSYSSGFDGYGTQARIEAGVFTDPVIFETPLQLKLKRLPKSDKMEENRKSILVETAQETLALPFDRTGSGLKLPIAKGAYRVRYQPLKASLPFRLRLHRALKVDYPDSDQPYSYEAVFLLNRDGEERHITLSMNQVYESEEGYRFYLSQITPGNPDRAPRVHLTVNYDPVKYWLTYPGGLIMAFGIFLLFGNFNIRRVKGRCCINNH